MGEIRKDKLLYINFPFLVTKDIRINLNILQIWWMDSTSSVINEQLKLKNNTTQV